MELRELGEISLEKQNITGLEVKVREFRTIPVGFLFKR